MMAVIGKNLKPKHREAAKGVLDRMGGAGAPRQTHTERGRVEDLAI